MLADSHCHLSDESFDSNLEDVISRANKVGVQYFLNAASKFDCLEKQLKICNTFQNVYTVTGVHPHDSAEYQNVTAEDVLNNTHHAKVVAIGECGLDYYYDFAPKDVQIKIFKEMIKAAQQSQLPLIVHTREAEEDTIDLLHSFYKKEPFTGVIHCYSSSLELAKEALAIGFYISASGIITFKNSELIRQSFATVPFNKLLIETDSPYLAPVPLRGKINEPSYIINTAQTLAAIKGVDFNFISDITTQNFFNLFQKIRQEND